MRHCVIDALLQQREELRKTFALIDDEQKKIIQQLERRLEKVEQSIGWKVSVYLKSLRETLCPLHSTRLSVYLWLRSALLVLMNGEWRSLPRRAWNAACRMDRPPQSSTRPARLRSAW